MNRKIYQALSLIILAAAVSGCIVIENPAHQTGELYLYNDASLTIDELYVTPASSPVWGTNKLSAPLPSGSVYLLTGMHADFYDVQAVINGTFSTYYGYVLNIPVSAGQRYNLHAYDSDFSGSLKIVNDTIGSYIEAVYISPAGAGSWGPNQITSNIAPGCTEHFYDLPADSYDVRIVWNAPPDSYYYSNMVDALSLLTLYVY